VVECGRTVQRLVKASFMSASGANAVAKARADHPRSRVTASIALLVVAVLLAPMTVVSAWARTQIESTDRYVATVAPLAEDPDVQQYVARAAADAIFERLELDDALASVLPEQLAALQPTLAAALRGFLTDARCARASAASSSSGWCWPHSWCWWSSRTTRPAGLARLRSS
jgi:hypothetical protein